MAREVKIFADGEEIRPETVMSQVKTHDGSSNVEQVINDISNRLTYVEDVPTTVRISPQIVDVSNGAWDIQIENWNDKFADFDNYRICVVQKSRGSVNKTLRHFTRSKWRVPMFYELKPHPNDGKQPVQNIEYCTFTPARRLRLATGVYSNSVISENALIRRSLTSTTTIDESRYVLKSNRSRKSSIGVALFKKTNKGVFGWERISNIAGISTSVGGTVTPGDVGRFIVRKIFTEI